MPLTWTSPKLPQKKTAVFMNTAEHAPLVHNGATLRNGGSYPARPFMEGAFIDPPLEFDALQVFQGRYQATNSIAKAFRSTAQQSNTHMKKLIRSKIWDWPGTTVRRNGRVVGSPRNIVDTGELLSQQQQVRFE